MEHSKLLMFPDYPGDVRWLFVPWDTSFGELLIFCQWSQDNLREKAAGAQTSGGFGLASAIFATALSSPAPSEHGLHQHSDDPAGDWGTGMVWTDDATWSGSTEPGLSLSILSIHMDVSSWMWKLDSRLPPNQWHGVAIMTVAYVDL
jgi:hypothetical protein